MSIYQLAFDEIKMTTDSITELQPFINLEHCHYCASLQLLTFDPHPVMLNIQPKHCCSPVLLHLPKRYQPSGWFPNFNQPMAHIYVFYQGKWRTYI